MRRLNVVMSSVLLLINVICTTAATANTACIHKVYQCVVSGHSDISPQAALKFVLVKSNEKGIYKINWSQPPHTPRSQITLDRTVWLIRNNHGLASFYGISGRYSKSPRFYAGTATIVFNKDRAVTTYYSHSLLSSGKILQKNGHLYCHSSGSPCIR